MGTGYATAPQIKDEQNENRNKRKKHYEVRKERTRSVRVNGILE